MRKLILTTLALAVLAVPAAAQTSAQADATVRARVYAPITIAATGGNIGGGIMDLGVVSTAGGVLSIPASNAASAVLFTVGGEAGVPITITTTVNPLISGANSLTLTPNWLWDPTSTNPGGAGAAALPGSVSLSPTGAYYMWLGGSVTIPAAQAAGTYTGTVRVAVAYQ